MGYELGWRQSRKKPFSSVQKEQARHVQLYLGEDLFDIAWVGPTIARVDSENNPNPNYDKQRAALKREFQGHNALKEVIDNWRDGLIGEPFLISVKRTDGESLEGDERGAEAFKALTRWITHVQNMAVQTDPSLTTFCQMNPWAEFVLSLGVCGQAALRVWTPPRFENDPDPVKRIHLHVPAVGSVWPEFDDYGFLKKVVYTHAGPDGASTEEVHEYENGRYTITVGASTEEVHEYENGRYTITVGEEVTEVPSGKWRLLVAHAASLITESAEAKQAAVCHELTMLLRNQQHAGFRRRTMLNAVVPDVPQMKGAGFDEYQYGIVEGESGKERHTTPQIHESEPFPIENSVGSVKLNRELLYSEFSQAHLLETGGDLSGESRVQQRQNYDVLLRGWSERIEAAFAHVFDVVLEELGFEGYESVVDLKITTGKLSTEEERVILEKVRDQMMSRRTALALLGDVSDVEAEIEKIKSEAEERAAMIELEMPNGENEIDEE